MSRFYAELPVLTEFSAVTFDYSGRHLHFIDGADGGFFSAAAAFKQRAARLSL